MGRGDIDRVHRGVLEHLPRGTVGGLDVELVRDMITAQAAKNTQARLAAQRAKDEARGVHALDDLDERPTDGYYDPADDSDEAVAHRDAAAAKTEAVGWVQIECDVRQGTHDDAVSYGMGCNAVHGLRRTNADKRHAVSMALGLWPDRADRRVWCWRWCHTRFASDDCAVRFFERFVDQLRHYDESRAD